MSHQTTIDGAQLRSAIQDEYTEVATVPAKGFHFHTGRPLASRLDYPADRIAGLPDSVVESFAGVGNPFSWGEPAPGESVLDLGSGAGFDILLAAHMVGPRGHAIGVDMTPAMVAKARHNAELLGLANVDIREGYLEELPVADDSIDLVISNGVLNLCPDKGAVLRETYRVLKPGGRLQLSDIVVGRQVPEDAKTDISLWTGCIAGALLEPELDGLLKAAGFTDIAFSAQRYDAFSEAPQESSAAEFGTLGVNIRAVKPGRDVSSPRPQGVGGARMTETDPTTGAHPAEDGPPEAARQHDLGTRGIHAGETPNTGSSAHGVPISQNTRIRFRSYDHVQAWRAGSLIWPLGNETIRLSVGLEDIADLERDFRNALAALERRAPTR